MTQDLFYIYKFGSSQELSRTLTYLRIPFPSTKKASRLKTADKTNLPGAFSLNFNII